MVVKRGEERGRVWVGGEEVGCKAGKVGWMEGRSIYGVRERVTATFGGGQKQD